MDVRHGQRTLVHPRNTSRGSNICWELCLSLISGDDGNKVCRRKKEPPQRWSYDSVIRRGTYNNFSEISTAIVVAIGKEDLTYLLATQAQRKLASFSPILKRRKKANPFQRRLRRENCPEEKAYFTPWKRSATCLPKIFLSSKLSDFFSYGKVTSMFPVHQQLE